MDSDEAPGAGVAAPKRGYVRFSAAVARAVCWRTAAGESQAEICADPEMPCVDSVLSWARRYPPFGRAYARARALGGRGVTGRGSSFCPLVANEIVARISEGETLPSITADARMPSLRTLYRWRDAHPEFDQEVIQAREALAERFSDLGWKLAMEATPETAYLTHVRLGQLRWTAAVFGPRTYGKLKPTEPPKPPEVQEVCYRHFEIEVNKVTGLRRVISWAPDPETLKPVRDSEGEWCEPVDPVAKAAGLEILIKQGRAREAPAGPPPDDPEGWC